MELEQRIRLSRQGVIPSAGVPGPRELLLRKRSPIVGMVWFGTSVAGSAEAGCGLFTVNAVFTT